MQKYELMRLQEQVERKKSLEKRKDTLAERKRFLFSEECRLAVLREKEDADVAKWEHGSLAAFFYSIVGKKEERLEKEKAEAYEAAVKHDAVKAELSAVEADLEQVNRELESLKNCEWEYKQAVDAKAAELAAEGKDNGILHLQQEQAKIRERYRELQEAIEAGNRALDHVRSVKKYLEEAKDLGHWDMAGGGLIVSMMKHDKIQDAQRGMEHLQIALGRFCTELKDVEIETDLSLNIGEFLYIADFIFDGFFVDWEVQNKINDARNRISALEGQIVLICRQLRNEDRKLDETLLRLQEDWRKRICEAE